jgi:hypothetical protein
MAHGSSARPLDPATEEPRPEARPLLFKPDHPRAIDRHIDYFEGAPASRGDADAEDACGDAFLERLA